MTPERCTVEKRSPVCGSRRWPALTRDGGGRPAGERDAVLDRLCRDDPALRAEVEAFLAASLDATPRIRGAIGRVAGALAPRAEPQFGATLELIANSKPRPRVSDELIGARERWR